MHLWSRRTAAPSSRLFQLRGDAGFALEPASIIGFAAERLLDGDLAFELRIARGDHAAHAAAPELITYHEPRIDLLGETYLIGGVA